MNLLSFFLFDWLLEYLNTPKIEMTTTIELLGILSIGIIAFAVLGIVTVIAIIINEIKKRSDGK